MIHIENYSEYAKKELVQIMESLDQPVLNAYEVTIRLCALLSCKNCPVFIYDADSRTDDERCNQYLPCSEELYKWLKQEFSNEI